MRQVYLYCWDWLSASCFPLNWPSLDDASGRNAFTEFHENPTEVFVADTRLKTDGQIDRRTHGSAWWPLTAFSFPLERTPNKRQLLQVWLQPVQNVYSAGFWTEQETSMWWTLNWPSEYETEMATPNFCTVQRLKSLYVDIKLLLTVWLQAQRVLLSRIYDDTVPWWTAIAKSV